MTDAPLGSGAPAKTVSAPAADRSPAPAWCVALIYVVAVAMHLSAPLTGDVSWLLTVSERMLEGQQLYIDIMEPNPPMSAWIYLPWVWLAHRIGATPELVVTLAVVGFAALAVEATGRTLVRARQIGQGAFWWRLVGALAFVVAPISTFAQREHVAILAVLPLLACLASRGSGRTPTAPERVIAGLLGGFALSIKPHFALGLFLPALATAVMRRSLRPLVGLECVIAGLVVVAYAASVVAFYPAYRSDMLPLTLAIYVPNRLVWDKLLFGVEPLIVALEVIAVVLLRPAFARSPLGVVLIAAIVGFVIAYAIQGRGWLYHLLPAWTLAILAFGLSLGDKPAFWRALGVKRLLIAAVGAYLMLAPVGEFLVWRDPYRPLINALAPFGPRPKIGLLTDSLKLGSPLHREVGGTLVGRSPSLWMTGNAMALCTGETDAARLAVCEAATVRERQAFRDDVLRTPPDVFLVEQAGVDWLGWARADPELAAVLDRYRQTTTAWIGSVGVAVLARDPAR